MSETEPQFKGPAIAVVVPVHNGAAFLQQCLASLAAQTFGDFACFVVDDGSTDESAELAAAWESRDWVKVRCITTSRTISELLWYRCQGSATANSSASVTK